MPANDLKEATQIEPVLQLRSETDACRRGGSPQPSHAPQNEVREASARAEPDHSDEPSSLAVLYPFNPMAKGERRSTAEIRAIQDSKLYSAICSRPNESIQRLNRMMTQEEALRTVSAATAKPLKSGDIVILATDPGRLGFLGQAIESLGPVLKAARITILIMSDEMGLCIVPEARRTLPIPTEAPK